MDSVPQTSETGVCRNCGAERPRSELRYKGVDKKGERCYCKNDCEARQSSDVLALVPGNAEQFYDRVRGLYNLTAMWRAAGCPKNNRPASWMRTQQYQDFVSALSIALDGSIVVEDHSLGQSGRGGGSWAHWQIAVEYARYLSPVFAIQWNEYAAAYLRGEQRQVAIVTPSPVPPDAIEQVTTGLMTIFTNIVRDAVDQVLRDRMGEMPQQTAETWEAVKGATVIEREVTREVRVEWVANGYCYLAVEPTKGLISIGETHKHPAVRMKDSDYNGAKGSDGRWVAVWAFRTDNRKEAEKTLHRLALTAGAKEMQTGTRGTYQFDQRIVDDFRRLPQQLLYADLRRWVSEGQLFVPQMFQAEAL